MTRLLCFLVLGAMTVGPASAEQYWVSYEGNDYPENEGWTRQYCDENGIFGQGGAVRTLEDGALVLDSLRSIMIVDYYEMRRPIDPEPGERFVMRWRLKIDSVPDLFDPGVVVFSNSRTAVSFHFTEKTVSSSFESNLVATFEPYKFHTFELVSQKMMQYQLSIDGIPALQGEFERVAESSRVAWGDGVQGATSVTDWDYFEFGVVPEPNALILMLCLVLRSWNGSRN